MNNSMTIKVLCVISIVMYFVYYNYWRVGDLWHSSEAISIISNFASPVWFKVSDWWHYLSFFVWNLVYFFIFLGFYKFKHALLFLIVLGFFLNTSSEVVVMTNIDLIILDIWRLSDGMLLYLLYFGVNAESK